QAPASNCGRADTCPRERPSGPKRCHRGISPPRFNAYGSAVFSLRSSPICHPIQLLYVCIPVHNEAPTAGLVLWRIRKAFADFQREYELIVFNDGSTDATAEVLAPYTDALPLTILGGPQHVGYAKALDVLFRAALDRCRYPRRD